MLAAAVADRYSGKGWIVVEEVWDKTGVSGRRRADALAVGTWPSQGFEIHGFEVKISRSDWLKELADRDKQAAVGAYCDQWWVVAPAGVVDPKELPPLWGLYAAAPAAEDAWRLRVARRAGRNDDVQPVDRKFLASVLRRAVEQDDVVRRRKNAAEVREAFERGKDSASASLRFERERAERSFAELAAVCARFEEETGVPLASFRWASIRNNATVAQFKRFCAVDDALHRLRGVDLPRAVDALQSALREVERIRKLVGDAEDASHGPY